MIEVTLDDQGEAWNSKKHTPTQRIKMLKILNFNKLNSKKKLETILSSRKTKQKTESKQVKKNFTKCKKTWR